MTIRTNQINARMQVLQGNEEDFNPGILLPGEWAVSTDTKYVRMCMAPGVVVRMATYEAFEEDMRQIQIILATCEDIREAVEAFNNLAEQHADSAATSASNAKIYATESESFAHGGTNTRENEDVDNAQYYSEQAKRVAEGLQGVLIPLGTINFSELPTSDIIPGAFYNIRDSFVSDERFNDGGGVNYGAGNNVYYTAENMWDVLTGTQVVGVKGDKESAYRTGNVNLTAESIGAVPISGGTISGTTTINGITTSEPIYVISAEQYILMFDITDWYDSAIGQGVEKKGFIGTVFSNRTFGYTTPDGTAKLVISASYENKENAVDGARLTLNIDDDRWMKPMVVRRVTESGETEEAETSYWLALAVNGLARNITFSGIFSGDFDGTVVRKDSGLITEVITDYTKSNAPVTGVKGNAESTYREGNVNLTAENIGALRITGGTYGNTAFGTGDITQWGECATSTIGGQTENVTGDGWGTLLKFGGIRPVCLYNPWNSGGLYVSYNNSTTWNKLACTTDNVASAHELRSYAKEGHSYAEKYLMRSAFTAFEDKSRFKLTIRNNYDADKTTYETAVDYAVKAQKDAKGNVIADTYATKSDTGMLRQEIEDRLDSFRLIDSQYLSDTGEYYVDLLKQNAMYLLFTIEQNLSTGEAYGYRVQMIVTTSIGTAAAFVYNKSIAASTNSGVTIKTVNNDDALQFGITIKNTSAARNVKFTLFQVL